MSFPRHRAGPGLHNIRCGYLLPCLLFKSLNNTLGVNVYKHVQSDATLADNTDTVVRVFSVSRACVLLEFLNGCCLMVSPIAEHSHLRQRMDGCQSESFLNQGCSNFNEFHFSSFLGLAQLHAAFVIILNVKLTRESCACCFVAARSRCLNIACEP